VAARELLANGSLSLALSSLNVRSRGALFGGAALHWKAARSALSSMRAIFALYLQYIAWLLGAVRCATHSPAG
jgi:hypothetical protein